MSIFNLNNQIQIERIQWVRHVPWEKYNIIRAGVIPFTVRDNHVYICLGVDKQSKELTDLAGGIRETDINPLEGAIREFKEESKEVFGEENYRSENYLDSPCLIKKIPFKNKLDKDYHMMIIFQEVEEMFLKTALPIFNTKDVTSADEVIALLWCSESVFKQMVYNQDNNRMYAKVKKFIASCISFRRLMYFLKLKSSLSKNIPSFSEHIILRFDYSDLIEQKDPQCSFKRFRMDTRRPRLNLTGHTISAQS